MKTHFFTESYKPFDELLFSVRGKLWFISLTLIIVTTLLFALVSARPTIVMIVFELLLTVASFILARPVAIIVMLVKIKRWNQDRKDSELLEAVRENNFINVRALIWAGADVNKQHREDNADPWDAWTNYTYRHVYPLDYSTGEIKNILLKHGAVPCPDQKIYPY